jgi:hypothetical protein
VVVFTIGSIRLVTAPTCDVSWAFRAGLYDERAIDEKAGRTKPPLVWHWRRVEGSASKRR